MYIKLMSMAHNLSKYSTIVLYGAGDVARQIYAELCKVNIMVDFCVVTEKQDDCFMQILPIYQIDECLCDLRDNDTIILIAVSKLYEEEIEGILKSYNIYNFLKYSDFIVNFLEDYRNKNIEQCIEEVVEWQIVSQKRGWHEFEALKERLEKEICIQKGNTILFLIGDLTPRVLKIVKALQNIGTKIKVIFYPDAFVRTVCKEEFHKLRVAYTECRCVQELLYAVITEHAKIVHMFSHRVNTIIPYVLIKMRSILPPLIYDEYDIINEFYHNYPTDWLEEEKFCLEYADGVCNRGYELDYLMQHGGYHINGKTLHFFDYCRDDDLKTDTSKLDDTLSLCYAGGIITEKQYPNSAVACWIELARKCEEAHCHLHIYPFKWEEEAYAEYIKLEKDNKFFHFHSPVPSESLSQELSQYDYGIHPIRTGFLEQDVIAYNKKEKAIYGVANHFYDYLDAGIPIIAASPVLFAKSFEAMGVLLPWTIDEYDFEFLKRNKYKYRKKVETVRKELQMKNQIHKLVEFYDSLQ